MKLCSAVEGLEIVEGQRGDYDRLAKFHYRDGELGPYHKIFAIRPGIAVIVYKMPTPGLELRNVALSSVFDGLNKSDRLGLVNRSIRCISRVIVEPRYRGLGLASRLVRETMGLVGVEIVEAMAVMGEVNPFFEKAGMRAYHGGKLKRCEQLTEAMSLVGINEGQLVDPEGVQEKIDSLGKREKDFINRQIHVFMQCYGKRRGMEAGIERTRFAVNKLTLRPIYYIKRLIIDQ